MIRLFPRAKSEREFEAAFWSRARIEANDVGYLTIAASGHNPCTLHWTKNDGAVEAGRLLLLDAGVECDSLYTADVTRTLPVSGRFSPEQRTIYELVFEAQRVAMEAVAPGNDFLEPNRRAMRVLAEGLADLKILRVSADEALDPERQFFRRYTLHNVSHMLGLDVHDCARARANEYRYGKLREGMVLTVEPGLYFQPDDATVPPAFRGIGIRIEDDVAVTGDGSKTSPRSCRRARTTSRRGSRSDGRRLGVQLARRAGRRSRRLRRRAERRRSGRRSRRRRGVRRRSGGSTACGRELLFDRPLTERENDHARQVADAWKQIDQRERTGETRFFEDAPVEPDEKHENRGKDPEVHHQDARKDVWTERVLIHAKPPERRSEGTSGRLCARMHRTSCSVAITRPRAAC